MGSVSDKPIMDAASQVLDEFGVEHEVKILSAHRTPTALMEWVATLRERGFAAVVAAAGGAAHLAGVIAAQTTLPVIGVPIKGPLLEGLDALLSTVQMPSGVPVATVGVNGAKNGALLALSIISVTDGEIARKLMEFRKRQAENVLANNK